MNLINAINSLPTAPCDKGCPHVARCRDDKLACWRFLRYVGEVHGFREYQPRSGIDIPARDIYQRLYTC